MKRQGIIKIPGLSNNVNICDSMIERKKERGRREGERGRNGVRDAV